MESGYGSLIVEMGIFGGPLLWFLWVSVLLWQGWKVVRGFAKRCISRLALLSGGMPSSALVLLMYFAMAFYQNFVNNAYMWLLSWGALPLAEAR